MRSKAVRRSRIAASRPRRRSRGGRGDGAVELDGTGAGGRMGGYPAVSDRRAGARLRIAVEDQGRARCPRRALTCGSGAPSAIGCREVHHAVLDVAAAARRADADGDDRPDSHHGVLHPGRAQGHRLDPGAQRSEPRQPAADSGLGAAVRRCGEADVQGDRDPGGRERVPVPPGAVPGAGSLARDLGGDAVRSGARLLQHRCRSALRSGAHLHGRVRHHPRRLGGELQVRLPGRDALRGADRRL